MFDEGVFVGYRGYAQRGVRPLFPFGHGLSYTSFDSSELEVTDPRLATSTRRGLTGRVRVRVRNTGNRTCTEIVQVYHGELPAQADTPPRQLLGWARVTLRPGRERSVSVPIRLGTSEHQLSYRRTTDDSPRSGGWVTPRGDVPIHVGSSSQDVRARGTLPVR